MNRYKTVQGPLYLALAFRFPWDRGGRGRAACGDETLEAVALKHDEADRDLGSKLLVHWRVVVRTRQLHGLARGAITFRGVTAGTR